MAANVADDIFIFLNENDRIQIQTSLLFCYQESIMNLFFQLQLKFHWNMFLMIWLMSP